MMSGKDCAVVMWFRTEQVQVMQWGGEPTKPIEFDEGRRLEGEQFFVLAFADEKDATVLANRIREQLEYLPHLNQTGRTITLSHTMLTSFSPDDGTSVNNGATTLVANLEALIESQGRGKAHHA